MSSKRRRTALLRVYSPSFRSRYGDEMLDALDAEDAKSSRRQRIANDVDFARNGVAQRFGSDVVMDIEGGIRWVGTVALAICVAWSTVSLTSSIAWVGFAPANLRIALLWFVVLAASVGRLLLPRRGAHVLWFIGLLAVLVSTYLGSLPRTAPPSDLILGSWAYLLRWQTAAIAFLLLLGAAAPIGLRRSSIATTSLGLIGGIVLTVRFFSFARFSGASSYLWISDGRPRSNVYASGTTPTFRNELVRGTFVDLARVDLLPNFGWWCLAGLIVLASVGLLRPKAAVAAIVAAVVALGAALVFHAMSGVPTSFRYLIPLAIIAESVIVLAASWRPGERREPSARHRQTSSRISRSA